MPKTDIAGKRYPALLVFSCLATSSEFENSNIKSPRRGRMKVQNKVCPKLGMFTVISCQNICFGNRCSTDV